MTNYELPHVLTPLSHGAINFLPLAARADVGATCVELEDTSQVATCTDQIS